MYDSAAFLLGGILGGVCMFLFLSFSGVTLVPTLAIGESELHWFEARLISHDVIAKKLIVEIPTGEIQATPFMLALTYNDETKILEAQYRSNSGYAYAVARHAYTDAHTLTKGDSLYITRTPQNGVLTARYITRITEAL